jgi:hypothetical protein
MINPALQLPAVIFVCAGAAAAVWWFMIMPVMRQGERYGEFYDTLKAVDATPWYRFRMRIKGLKMELFSSFLIIAPILITALEWIVDTPVLSMLPPKVQESWPLIVAVIGIIIKFLRGATTTPPGQPVQPYVSEVYVPTVDGTPDAALLMRGPQVLATRMAAVPGYDHELE